MKSIKETALNRREAVATLLAQRDQAYQGGLLVVSGLGSPTYDLHALGDRPDNFYLWGAMGSAALIGLGLALAQPQRKILVLTGDGEQLMGLGGLATIGVQQPANLSIVVLDNGRFGETGMQHSHTALGVNLTEVASACGFSRSQELTDMAQVKALSTNLFDDKGTSFHCVSIAAVNHPRSLAPQDGSHLKSRLRAHLGFTEV